MIAIASSRANLTLAAIVGLVTSFHMAYVLGGVAPSQFAGLLSAYVLAVAVVWWVVVDARTRGHVPCFDFGLLLAIFFPLSVVWYAIWSRGWRGVLLLAGLCGLVLIPWILPLVVVLVA